MTKIKMNEIERDPEVLVINENTIKSGIFKKAFNTFWTNNVSKINLYHNMKEWWDITKNKLKALCIEISSKLNTSKKTLKIIEAKLEYLKSKNDDSHVNDIITLEQNIKDVYEQKTESTLLRLKSKWYEEGEQSSKYIFQLEKSKGQEKLWDKMKCEDGTYKFDIDSILNEQVKVYEKSFKMEGWDEKMEDYLLSVAKETLDDREKTDLCYGT
jgi:hypothetical protein